MSLRRATGRAAFAGDHALPGMLHVALRRSDLAHARVVRADASASRSMPGVVAVFTPEDAPDLLGSIARFHGDRLAVAAAEEPELARRAADAIELELEPLPAVLDPEKALADERNVAARLVARCGEPEQALGDADDVVEGVWRVPFAPGVSLEPPVAITWLDEDRRLVVRTSAEAPFRVRGLLADRLGLPAARIRVVRPLVAGGAGGRTQMAVEDVCALVTLRTGRPARLVLSAEEELTTTPGRPAETVRLRLGLRDGRMSALEVALLVDIGAEGDAIEDLLRSAARNALGVYSVPHVRFEATAVRTHRPPALAPRGADAVAAFAVEGAVSEAAAILGEDPGTFRRRHLRGPEDPGSELLAELGEPPGAGDARPIAALLAAGVRAGARGRRWRPAAATTRTGTGVAVARRGAAVGAGAGAAASIRLLEDGSFTLAAGPSAAGGTDEGAYTEAAAAILGVPARRVVCAAADTDLAPFETGDALPAFFAAGRAVEEAARLARERIRQAGAALLRAPMDEARVEDGQVTAGGGRAVTFAQIGAAALHAGQPMVLTAAPAPASAPPALASVLADAEVDVETGVVRVSRLSAVVAGGPFADPRPARSLVEGALALALEQALVGGLSFDGQGRPYLRSMRRWPLVTASDVPPLVVTFVPSDDPGSRFGAAALGEAAGRAALAAITAAVARAIGTPIRELPLTSERVLDALDLTRP